MSTFDHNTFTGGAGEELAKEYLVERGFLFIESNYNTRVGEIDLVMRKGKTLYFIEVKTRLGKKFGYPEQSVTNSKIRKIERTINYYLTHNTKFLMLKRELLVVSILYEGINLPPDIRVFEI